jgi:2-methylcitrate dehydratase PrpD
MHSHDYDDVAEFIYAHPSAVLFPALLAVAETETAPGRALLECYAVGFQVASAIGAALPVKEHYARGWHATSTIGVIAATAGVCRLLGLTPLQVRHALGIAASTAAGSRQNFGTFTKPLHAGLAGRNAVTAARLAQQGFTADSSQLESPLGYFAMYGATTTDLSAGQRSLADRWALLREGISVKKHPCCYSTHCAADAALSLFGRLDPNQIRSVKLTLEPGALEPLIHHRPNTGLEAKFSAEYVVAAALTDGKLALETFTDGAVNRPELQSLLRRIDVREAAIPPFGADFVNSYATLEIESDAEAMRSRVDVPKGDARDPLTDAERAEKFRDCIAFSQSGWNADDLLVELRGIESLERLTGFGHIRSHS